MWSNPIVLVEHLPARLPESLRGQVAGLQTYLDSVWASRSVLHDEDTEKPNSTEQPFLKFEFRKGKETIRAGQYVGFIQYAGQTIQLLPKLFTDRDSDTAFRHLLWWLDYSERVYFPFTDLLTDSEPIDDFPDALIRYFARFTHSLISEQPYHQYQEVTETMYQLRGRLNMQDYVNDSLTRGNWHQLVCDYEPFQFNNRLNQIIKYVARQLMHLCRPETRRQLERVVFVLDEVDDCPCLAQDCDTVQLNRFFQPYEHCLAMCRFFLQHHYISQQDARHRHFCFLIPMDRLYEDVVTFMIQQTVGHLFSVRPKAKTYLARLVGTQGQLTHNQNDNVFQIENDLLLEDNQSRQVVAVVDTKYKLRGDEAKDKKAGVSQADMYQMVSYALRRNTYQVFLLYPVRHNAPPAETILFSVSPGWPDSIPVYIRAASLRITGPSKQIMEAQLAADIKGVFAQLTGAASAPGSNYS